MSASTHCLKFETFTQPSRFDSSGGYMKVIIAQDKGFAQAGFLNVLKLATKLNVSLTPGKGFDYHP